jgi:large subunit ribosomal protein L14
MVQRGTNLTIADNSGAKIAKVIGIPGYSKRLTVGIGDIVNVAVQKATPHSGVKAHEYRQQL